MKINQILKIAAVSAGVVATNPKTPFENQNENDLDENVSKVELSHWEDAGTWTKSID